MLSTILLAACGKTDDATASAGDTESGSSTGTTGDQPTTDPGVSDSEPQNCTPGQSVACACKDGSDGAQVCAVDGKSFGVCECEGGGSNSVSDSVDPTSATTEVDATTTAVDMTTTGVDMTTTDGTTGPDTTTGANVCEDPGEEPNETEDDAVDLGDQTCQAEDSTLMGVLDGVDDVDWFVYRGIDGMGCGFENPFVSHTLMASDTVRLCVFAECDQGEPQFLCPDMAPGEDSPDGRPGCCSDGDLTFQFNCMGSQNETADFYVRLDQAPENACVDYSVTYGFGPLN